MANIKVTVDHPISDGTKLRFRTPCESTEVDGLVVKYPVQDGVGYALKTFSFVDAHGKELSGVGNVFASDVMIGVLLDVTKGRAYIKNADTNSYIEDIRETLNRLDNERKTIFADAGRIVKECDEATKKANDAAKGVVTIEQNNQKALRFWAGTKEEYEAEKSTIPANTFCIITDDATDGRVPAGYGNYGEVVPKLIGDLQFENENALEEELNKIISEMAELEVRRFSFMVDTLAQSAWLATLFKSSEGYATLDCSSGFGRRVTWASKTLYDGVWTPWEWQNPSMEVGVEYRTTERWNGKPIYRKLVNYSFDNDIGDSSSFVDITVAHNISGFDSLVRCMVTTNGNANLPFVAQSGGVSSVKKVDATNVYIRIVNDVWKTPTFLIDIAYVKE